MDASIAVNFPSVSKHVVACRLSFYTIRRCFYCFHSRVVLSVLRFRCSPSPRQRLLLWDDQVSKGGEVCLRLVVVLVLCWERVQRLSVSYLRVAEEEDTEDDEYDEDGGDNIDGEGAGGGGESVQIRQKRLSRQNKSFV